VHLVNNNVINLTAKDGNVGVGTTSPQSKLHINGSNNVLAGNPLRENYHLALINPANDTGEGVGMAFGISAGNSIGSSIYHVREGANSHGSLHFATRPSGGDITERMKIASNGRVGIGTDDPGQLLHINNNSGNAYIKVTSGSATSGAGVDLIRGGGVRQWRIENSSVADFYLSYGDLILQTESYDVANNPITQYAFNPTAFFPARDNSISLGISGRRWSVIHSANGTASISDVRKKSNIANIQYGLDEVMRLRPVSFTWKENPQWGTKLGLIAQEVEHVVKEVVLHGNVEDAYDEAGNLQPGSDEYGMFYSDLIPVLIKAIQDQQALIEAMEDRIQTLEENANYSAKN
jgi:hypothetical protein